MEFIKSNFGTLIGMMAPLAIIVLTLYFIAKSHSAATIYNKLWSLFYGEKEFHNPLINDFSKSQHDIDKFNFVYGFRFETIQQIEAFLDWIKKYDYQLYWFSHLGGYFNKVTFDVSGTKPWLKWTTFFIGLLGLAGFVLWVIHRPFSDPSGKMPYIDYFTSYAYAFEILLFSTLILLISKAQNKANNALSKMINQHYIYVRDNHLDK